MEHPFDRFAYAHETNSSAVARRDANVMSKECNEAEPVATTSNGDPPPESAFDSWLFGA